MFNKNLFLQLVFICTLFFTSLSFADDDNKAINVSAAQPQFVIRLPANATTGYSWFLNEYDNQLLEVVSYAYEKPAQVMPGAGGTAIWIFKVKPEGFTVPRMSIISMIYAQPWNLLQAQEKKITIVIQSQ